jgi:hypothetical protein
MGFKSLEEDYQRPCLYYLTDPIRITGNDSSPDKPDALAIPSGDMGSRVLKLAKDLMKKVIVKPGN